MSLTSRYCSQCGGEIVTRTVDDRSREVCAECGKVFYRNPLPVAASVVLNRDREVLLVKRKNEPKKGMWCLPIGFAELGESIADAARRELHEETGVEGMVLRLLDVDSYGSDFYGDLLIVTFELAKTGGAVCAGDDAEEVAYYSLDRLPTLAFSSNDKALAACIEAYRDTWAIQDSFQHLESDAGEEMLSDTLLRLIADHAEEVARAWLAEVRVNPTTVSYRRIDLEELFERGSQAVAQFGRWLKGDVVGEEVRTFCRALGRERKAQGFALHEVVSSLSLLRKHLWEYARTHGVWERPIDVYRVLELNRRIVVFFDKALYHTARAFEEDDSDATAG